MSDLKRIYQSETKKYLIKIKDPDTGDSINLDTLIDVIVVVYTKNNNREVKHMSMNGTDDSTIMDKKDGTTLVLPLEHSIVKEITPGQLAVQITLLWEDTDFDDEIARKSYTADLNPVKQAIVN